MRTLEFVAMSSITPEELTNQGERMIEGNWWGYWAHLAPYHFALGMMSHGSVLDVGSGSGYGAAHLARHGAKVIAIDGSDVAIAHSRQRYAGDNVTFETVDLNKNLPFGDKFFDLVFSSNVFEHISNIDGLIAECARVVTSDGVVLVIVPTMQSAEIMASDMENRFHLHHLPGSAWYAKLKRFFVEVQCHTYIGAGNFPDAQSQIEESRRRSEDVTIRETDFAFPAVSLEEFQACAETIGGVFVCRQSRAEPGVESISERTPVAWHEAEVAARLIGRGLDSAAKLEVTERRVSVLEAESAALQARLTQAQDASDQQRLRIESIHANVVTEYSAELLYVKNRLATSEQRTSGLENSTSWRMTGPFRKIVRLLT